MKPSFKFIPVEPGASGKGPVRLQVIFNRRPLKYRTVFQLSPEEFNLLFTLNVPNHLLGILTSLNEIKKTVQDFIDEMPVFSFEVFEAEYIDFNPLFTDRKEKATRSAIRMKEEQGEVTPFDFEPYLKKFPILKEDPKVNTRISYVYIRIIRKLIEEGRVGNALVYQDSYYCLRKYRGNVRFIDITSTYLRQFEEWMTRRGRTRSTIGIKLRHLRSVFNEADFLKIIDKRTCYPFGKRSYRIPNGSNVKRAIKKDGLKTLYDCQPDNMDHEKALDLWFFLYFGNGMNPKDMVYLKYKNVKDGFIIFDRAKTKYTRGENARPVMVAINADIERIITKWGNPDQHPDNYIFGLMDDRLNPLEQHFRVRSVVKFINDRMKQICESKNVDAEGITKETRHSCATMLKRAGASIEFIQECLGHLNKTTTEKYLDQFDAETKQEFAVALTAFKAHAVA